VEAVGSAEDALRLADDLDGYGRIPRVALVDVDLPGMSGLDLISRLSASHPALVPVLVTASDDERVFEAVRDGGLLYVRKPVDVGRLMALLSEIPALDRHAGGRDPAGNGNGRSH
jgi:DNA-binding response OmpR family regulator